MDPLSPWTYGRRNARKILPTLIILTFVVMLVVVILSVLRGLKESTLIYTREFEYWTVIFPKRETRVSPETIDRIARHPDVARVIDSRNCVVRMRALIAYVPYQFRAMKREEMDALMNLSSARIREGRLPSPGTNEVALHDSCMRANGWNLGQEFGLDVQEDDWMPGRFRVVGVLEGPAPVGFASFEYLNSPLLYLYSPKLWERVIVVAKPGRLEALNRYLRSLPDVKAWDRARAVQEVSDWFDRLILILNFVSILLISVVSLVVGLINNIFFAQRMDEFAILLAIGHTRRRLVFKVVLESAGIMTLAWTAGVGTAIGTLEAFRLTVLEPRGIAMPVLQGIPMAVSALLPAVAQVFASVTVAGRLRRLDPVSIIERRG
jgi:ABC-type lipoprotein release transport system permease subunit